MNWLQDCVDVAGEKYWTNVVVVPQPKRRFWDVLLCGLTTKKLVPGPERSKEEAQFRRDFVETLMCGMPSMRDPVPDEMLDAA
jgi:hypothetical protein